MTTNYDLIAEQYKLSKQQPWRTHLEAHTLMELIGDPSGLSVMDVACGEGFYTRMIRQRGAATVTGVDLSEGMIQLARQQELQYRQGIEYIVGDARNLPSVSHDLVVAAYLLNYAQTRDELQAMCDGIARCVKPGGRFVTVNSNPACEFPTAPSYRKYGFETTVLGAWQEGAPVRWKFYLEDSTFELENYFLDIAIHEEALAAAGFREIRWHAPRLSREGKATYNTNFWADFLGRPPVILLECVK